MLKIDNITIAYKDVPTVVDFSLDMAGGQIVSLVGESGSGKTTVIRAVLGLLAGGGKVTRGDILFNGKSLLKNTQAQPGALPALLSPPGTDLLVVALQQDAFLGRRLW